MARPTYTFPIWAANSVHNDPGQPWHAQPSKVQPSAGQIAAGYLPATLAPAEWANWWQNAAGEWIQYLDEARGVGVDALNAHFQSETDPLAPITRKTFVVSNPVTAGIQFLPSAGGNYSSSGDPTYSAEIWFHLNEILQHRCRVVGAGVYITPAAGHTAIPAQLPVLTLERCYPGETNYNLGTGNLVGQFTPGSSDSAQLASYHALSQMSLTVTSPGALCDLQTYFYRLKLVAEAGAGALAGFTVRGAWVALTSAQGLCVGGYT